MGDFYFTLYTNPSIGFSKLNKLPTNRAKVQIARKLVQIDYTPNTQGELSNNIIVKC